MLQFFKKANLLMFKDRVCLLGQKRCLKNAYLFIFFCFLPLVFFSRPSHSQEPEISSEYGLLVDHATGAFFFNKQADSSLSPGTVTKVMTAEVIFHALKSDLISLNTEYTVSEYAWRKGGGPSGTAAMFAELNSRIKIKDLLRGLLIQAGNDAALILAEGYAGSEDAFIQLMNERAKAIGLTHSHFANVTGFSNANQKTSAQDLVRLARYMIDTYPEFLSLFKEPEFTWNKIRQTNRNPLIGANPYIDGFMSGQTPDNGLSC